MKKEKEEKNNEEKKDNSKKKKIILIIIGIILLLILLFLLWWFNRKFDVTFKYNNGDADYTVKVKYLNIIDDKDVKKDLVYSEHSFVGYFETRDLTEEQKEKLKSENVTDICSQGFKLNDDKNKCVSETEFDFENTKIKKNTVIEALWSTISFTINPTSKTINEGESFKITATVTGSNDKTVKWSSKDSSIAQVDNSGKVIGVKKGNTDIIAESNGIKRTCKVTVNEVKKVEKKVEPPKDTGKLSLSASKSCVVGNNSVKITASFSGNALNKAITWTYPKCFSVQNTSSTIKTLTRNNSCSSTDNLNPSVSGKLSNGSSAKASFKYEPTLSFSVYDGSTKLSFDNGAYWGNNIKIVTNINASFSGSYIASTTSNSVTLRRDSGTTITIKTSCGQTSTVKITPIIN